MIIDKSQYIDIEEYQDIGIVIDIDRGQLLTLLAPKFQHWSCLRSVMSVDLYVASFNRCLWNHEQIDGEPPYLQILV